MCDYSLEHVASRAAAVDDKLISTRFGDSITRGFAAEGDPNVAVCLLPGTEIAFDREVEYDNILGAGRATVPTRVARFRQIDMEARHMHHDALEFANGQIVLLTRLVPGQRATVLQLPAKPQETTSEARKPAESLA
jgi:hypothetical protein